MGKTKIKSTSFNKKVIYKTSNERSKNNIMMASKKVRSSQRNNYVKFMNQRFPESAYFTSNDYANEWAKRFNSGSPERYMDTESLNIYNKIKG